MDRCTIPYISEWATNCVLWG